MSSKNPFRQNIQQQPASSPPAVPSASPALPSSGQQEDYDKDAFVTKVFNDSPPAYPEQRRSSKAKRVRIQTPPPLSPESTRNSLILDEPLPVLLESEGRHLGNLPSDISSDDSSDSTVDTSSEVPRQQVTLQQSTVKQDGETPLVSQPNIPDAFQERWGSTLPIANPFQRTLATMEPGNKYGVVEEKVENKSPRNETTGAKPSRTPIDVDDFKRLLLTGQTGQTPIDESSIPHIPSAPHTIASKSGTIQPSAPKQSIDDPGLSTQSDPSRTTLGAHVSDFGEVQDLSKGEKRPAPPPPKPRHGRPVVAHTSALTASTSLQEMDSASSSSTPLELPPSPTMDRVKPGLPASSEQSQSRSSIQQEQKTRPPAPPLARRTSNRSQSSILTTTPALTEPSKPSQTTGRAPPPPPARRSAASASALAGAGAPVRRPSDASIKSANETEAIATSGRPRSSSRSSSIVSNRAMPPPVPPSRRRGSSRSSLDAPSPADERPGKRSSVEMDRLVEETRTSDVNSEALLADLDAFQAEVDALRNQYGNPAR